MSELAPGIPVNRFFVIADAGSAPPCIKLLTRGAEPGFNTLPTSICDAVCANDPTAAIGDPAASFIVPTPVATTSGASAAACAATPLTIAPVTFLSSASLIAPTPGTVAASETLVGKSGVAAVVAFAAAKSELGGLAKAAAESVLICTSTP